MSRLETTLYPAMRNVLIPGMLMQALLTVPVGLRGGSCLTFFLFGDVEIGYEAGEREGSSALLFSLNLLTTHRCLRKLSLLE